MINVCHPDEYEARAAKARQSAESVLDAECCEIYRRTAASYTELAKMTARMDPSMLKTSMISQSEMSTSASTFDLRR
ncbi:hypothetical protein ACFOKI_16505 [Sphingomonas qilianensis]|uniref:Uncharacterized protein n=1 Tax=Sphingomonas qilianensis TaxID=1736690 RepID=A0ABU9XWR2_9SPHN